ncbi:Uncharacterized protein Fot_04008 [Forsythia ovata]|uniref:Uncharacterized protein n=1 Tax=Forsythia ovata TaxID=205694 RepID=A0ABD1XBC1_9LAMI
MSGTIISSTPNMVFPKLQDFARHLPSIYEEHDIHIVILENNSLAVQIKARRADKILRQCNMFTFNDREMPITSKEKLHCMCSRGRFGVITSYGDSPSIDNLSPSDQRFNHCIADLENHAISDIKWSSPEHFNELVLSTQ